MDRRDEPSLRPSQPGLPPPQMDNPTDEERYLLTRYTLAELGREEDFDSILKFLSPPPPITTIAPPGQFKGTKVGIIGGGAAGLSAAFELRKLGYDITIFEANDRRIGGRIFTYHFDLENNLYGELGAMRIPITHEASWHYINLFNLNTRPYVQENENAFLYVNHTRVRNDPNGANVMNYIYPKYNLRPWERTTPWMDLLNYAIETPLTEMTPEVREELLQVRAHYSEQIRYWDYFNIRQVMEMSGLSQPAISLLSRLSPFIGSFFYYSFIEVLMESNPLAFTHLYEIVGGMSNLPYALYNSLITSNPREYANIPMDALGNVTLKQGSWVDTISINKNGGVKLSYTIKNLVEEQSEDFDYVICAIPFSTLRNIRKFPQFSNIKTQAIKEVGYTAAHKTLFLCNRRFWEEGAPNERIVGGGSFTDLPISSIWYPADHAQCIVNSRRKGGWKWDIRKNCSPQEPGVLTAAYNFHSDAVRVGNMLDGIAFENIKRQVELVHGLPANYLDTIVEDFVKLNWNQQPWSLGGFCYFYPEQKRLFSYAMTLPEYNNRVFFAGEHLSSSHGWVNGAFQTGMKAANDIALMSKRETK